MRKISDIGEFGFIEEMSKKVKCNSSVIKGIGDDAAVLDLGSKEFLLFATDMLVEGVHFTKGTSAKLIGHKALACNISDIAAMGGVPTYAVVSVGVPKNLSVAFAKNLFEGINQLARKFKVVIVGGDTVKSRKLTINIALLGKVGKREVIYRKGAKAGDLICVTGPLGNSFKSKKHLKFVPKVKESQTLVKKAKPSSMIDITDGLAADLGHILKNSKVGADLYQDSIPLAKGSKVNNALYDGEDFELLFTLPQKKFKALNASRLKFHVIGKIVKQEQGLSISGKKIDIKGFTHF